MNIENLERIIEKEAKGEALDKVYYHLSGMLNFSYNIKEDMRLHLIPPFFGLRRVGKPSFNGTGRKLDRMEKARKNLPGLLKPLDIKFEYVPHKIYLKSYIKNPIPADGYEFIVRASLFIGAYGEVKYYTKRIHDEVYIVDQKLQRKGFDSLSKHYDPKIGLVGLWEKKWTQMK